MPSVWVELMGDPIPLARVAEFIHGDPSVGGIVTFEGATRLESDAEHGTLRYLEYEAYRAMAMRQLERIAQDAKDCWCLGRVAILHRLGRVAPADVSVIVAVAGGHRAGPFEACRWVIDTLKSHVAIWKKDVFADGHERWAESKVWDEGTEERREPRA